MCKFNLLEGTLASASLYSDTGSTLERGGIDVYFSIPRQPRVWATYGRCRLAWGNQNQKFIFKIKIEICAASQIFLLSTQM